jgi:hypothetical protein
VHDINLIRLPDRITWHEDSPHRQVTGGSGGTDMTTQALDASAGRARPAGRWLTGLGILREAQWAAPDVRRRLQLGLAGIWLLDAILQFQTFMFSKGFAQMLAGTGPGNPAVIASPIHWASQIISQHGTATNAAFALIQLAIGLGIAWRPTARLALAGSVAWAVVVWWFGEGLGGVLNGAASPVNGAPGAVIIYALLAVLLWPARSGTAGACKPAPFAASMATGAGAARALWLVLWGSLAYLALQPATAATGALSSMVGGMAAGEPGWLASTDNHLAAFLLHRGPGTAIVLAVVLAVIAVGIYLPRPAVRVVLVLALLTAAAIWIAEGLGGILTGGGTDPNSGPLLALLALSFWPLRVSGTARSADSAVVADARPTAD